MASRFWQKFLISAKIRFWQPYHGLRGAFRVLGPLEEERRTVEGLLGHGVVVDVFPVVLQQGRKELEEEKAAKCTGFVKISFTNWRTPSQTTGAHIGISETVPDKRRNCCNFECAELIRTKAKGHEVRASSAFKGSDANCPPIPPFLRILKFSDKITPREIKRTQPTDRKRLSWSRDQGFPVSRFDLIPSVAPPPVRARSMSARLGWTSSRMPCRRIVPSGSGNRGMSSVVSTYERKVDRARLDDWVEEAGSRITDMVEREQGPEQIPTFFQREKGSKNNLKGPDAPRGTRLYRLSSGFWRRARSNRPRFVCHRTNYNRISNESGENLVKGQ